MSPFLKRVYIVLYHLRSINRNWFIAHLSEDYCLYVLLNDNGTAILNDNTYEQALKALREVGIYISSISDVEKTAWYEEFSKNAEERIL